MTLDNRLRASIAAQMLMPREEQHGREELKRLELHLLQLRERIAQDTREAEEALQGLAEWHQLCEQENQNEPQQSD